MLRQLISDLYSGAIDPCSRNIDKTTKRYAQDRATADRADDFRKVLTPAQREQFDDYIAEHHYLDSLIEEDGFVEGFRLGGRMILAILETDPTPEITT